VLLRISVEVAYIVGFKIESEKQAPVVLNDGFFPKCAYCLEKNEERKVLILLTDELSFLGRKMAKIRAKGRLIENVRSIVDNTRTHSIVLDWSPGMGGGDTGPNPLELSIMSLVGCAITIFADTAKNSKVELTKLEVSAEAEKSPNSPKLTSVNLKVKVQGKARKEMLEAL